MRVAFHDFVADFDQRRLLAGEREIRLTPKAFQLLRLLIGSRPRALGKGELFAQLWPDTFVTENNLATLVAELRAALDDDARRLVSSELRTRSAMPSWAKSPNRRQRFIVNRWPAGCCFSPSAR